MEFDRVKANDVIPVGNVESMTLNECYDYCAKCTKKMGTNFYLGFKLLPKDKRKAVYASYAFCRYVDDIVDEEGFTKENIAKALQQWADDLELCYEGKATHPITRALADSVKNYPIPKSAFLDLIEGCKQDLIKTRYETFDELLAYCDLVATTISTISLNIFGYDNPVAVQYGKHLAVALQLTNILRDVGEDARKGRIYLPLEDLRRFGYTEAELLRGEINTQFYDLMEFQVDRAKNYYVKANPLIREIHRDCRVAIYLMGAVYVEVLNNIKSSNFNVYGKKAKLSFLQKQKLLLRATVTPFVSSLMYFIKL